MLLTQRMCNPLRRTHLDWIELEKNVIITDVCQTQRGVKFKKPN